MSECISQLEGSDDDAGTTPRALVLRETHFRFTSLLITHTSYFYDESAFEYVCVSLHVSARRGLCLTATEVCVLRSSAGSSVLPVSVQVRTRSSWEVSQQSLRLLSSLLLLLLSCCCPHRPSSRTLQRRAVMPGQSSFPWTCCQTGRPWSGSGVGPCLLSARCDVARLVTPRCSSWESLWTGRGRGDACSPPHARHDG